jgi:hypothetical protein
LIGILFFRFNFITCLEPNLTDFFKLAGQPALVIYPLKDITNIRVKVKCFENNFNFKIEKQFEFANIENLNRSHCMTTKSMCYSY